MASRPGTSCALRSFFLGAAIGFAFVLFMGAAIAHPAFGRNDAVRLGAPPDAARGRAGVFATCDPIAVLNLATAIGK
jgi:hypothetical protein